MGERGAASSFCQVDELTHKLGAARIDENEGSCRIGRLAMCSGWAVEASLSSETGYLEIASLLWMIYCRIACLKGSEEPPRSLYLCWSGLSGIRKGEVAVN